MYNLDSIKTSLTSYDIIDLLGIETKKSGKTTFIRCPEPTHQDNNIGSCRVSENGYVCYACGKFGSIIDLYLKTKNISFGKAVFELGNMLELTDEKIETCPLSKEDKEALGLKDCSAINKLWIEDKQTYHLIISTLIAERIKKLQGIKSQLNRNHISFIQIKSDEAIWKLNNLCNEWIIHLEGMRCEYDDEAI